MAQSFYNISKLNIKYFPEEVKAKLSRFAAEDEEIDGAILPIAHYAATRAGNVKEIAVFNDDGSKKYDVLSQDGMLGEIPAAGFFQASDKAGLADNIYKTLTAERAEAENSLTTDPIQSRIRQAIDQSIHDYGADSSGVSGGGASGGYLTTDPRSGTL